MFWFYNLLVASKVSQAKQTLLTEGVGGRGGGAFWLVSVKLGRNSNLFGGTKYYSRDQKNNYAKCFKCFEKSESKVRKVQAV